MLLILTNSRDVTADYLLTRLSTTAKPVVRFDTDTCLKTARLRFDSAGPKLYFGGFRHEPTDFDHVWYRRPERLVIPGDDHSPESKLTADEWAEGLEGFFAHIPRQRWMNHPAIESAASQKLEQLTRARSLGFRVPDTLVTQEPEELREFHRRHGGRLITKPMGKGYVDRGSPNLDSVIFTNRVRDDHLSDCEDLRACPTLFQEEIRKVSDVRITVVDDAIHAVELKANDGDGRQRCDIRRDNMHGVAHLPVCLPEDIGLRISALMNSYELRFAAIDMAVTEEGNWVFFEINPNGQWAWMDLKGVTDIASSFVASFARQL